MVLFAPGRAQGYGVQRKVARSPSPPSSPRSNTGHHADSMASHDGAGYLGLWKDQLPLFPGGRAWYLFPPNDSPRSARTVREHARQELLQREAGSYRGEVPALAMPSPRRISHRVLPLKDYLQPRSPEADASGPQLSRQHLLHQMHLNHGLSNEQIIGQLRKVKWFRDISFPQVQVLYNRARHMFFTRYSTIIREGNLGSSFYVLIQGRIHCTNSSGQVNVILGPGSSFGEGALVTEVRREAKVVALEDCYLMQFNASDLEGLPVELQEVRVHVFRQLLRKVQFFQHIGESQRERLAAITQLQYFQTGDEVFKEGDIGDTLYIIVNGRVSMLKKIEQAAGSEPQIVATYSSKDELPWFGELAIVGAKPRGATARCDEPTKLLMVHADNFPQLVDIVPHFQELLQNAASTYSAINSMLQDKEALGKALNSAIESQLTDAMSSAAGISMPLSAVETNWERMTRMLIALEKALHEGQEQTHGTEGGSPGGDPLLI
jgi:CRP-like cAMP-binding protein